MTSPLSINLPFLRQRNRVSVADIIDNAPHTRRKNVTRIHNTENEAVA